MTHPDDLRRDTHTERKKSVVLFADIKGYTAMIREDEALALKKLGQFKDQLESDVNLFGGRIIHFYGDGCLAIFDQPDESIKCARILQRGFERAHIPVRIGLHYGTVLLQDGNVYGDAVNIASRIESMGIPGSILFSKDLMTNLQEKHIFSSESIGQYQFKYIDEPLEIFAVNNAGIAVPSIAHFNTKRNYFKKYNPVRDMNWKWVSAILVGLLMTLSISLINRPEADATELAAATITSSSQKSVAVMPFMASVDKNQELGNALSDEIRSALDSEANIQVTDKSTSIVAHSAMGITDHQMRSILKADYILCGQVKIEDDKIRITTELRSSGDNDIIWSREYKHDLFRIADIRENICENVLEVLKSNQAVKSISQYPVETVRLDRDQRIFLYSLKDKDSITYSII